jgi:cell division transport system permease protein
MRRFDFYFKETASGLRRNGILAFAAMITSFIALFLFGLALLISREFDLVIENITGNVEVAVYLSDPATPDTVARITGELDKLSAVDSVTFESKAQAFAHAQVLFRDQQGLLQGADENTFPASLRVKLNDPGQFAQISAALQCSSDAEGKLVCAEPGVAQLADFRNLLTSLNRITNFMRFGLGLIALVMLVAAMILVSNTLRMGMFSRRKEIGIMRLVGATNWRIRVPFLIEGLVESLVGALLAIAFLFGVKTYFTEQIRGRLAFLPLIQNSDVFTVTLWILVLATVIAIVAGTIGMRRFLDV